MLPATPSDNGWRSSTAPLPITVVATGMCASLCSAASSPAAPEHVNAAAGDDQWAAAPRREAPPPRRAAATPARGRSSGKTPRSACADRRFARSLEKQVGRQHQDGRARPAARRGREGHVDIVDGARRLAHAAHPFGAALEERDVIEILEGVAVGLVAVHVLDQRDDGDRGSSTPRRGRARAASRPGRSAP